MSDYNKPQIDKLVPDVGFNDDLPASFPWWVWTYQPGQARHIDIWNAFHDRSETLNINCLHERDVSAPRYWGKLNVDSFTDSFKNTEVNILYSLYPKFIGKNELYTSKLLSPNKYFFPIFFLYWTFVESFHYNFEWWEPSVTDDLSTKGCTRHFLTFNRNCRHHRIAFIQSLYDEGLLENNYYSLIYKNIDFQWYKDTEYNKLYKPEDITVPINDLQQFTNNYKLYTLPDEFVDSAFQIVTETTDNVIMLTEKTFVPIITKKPFITFGGVRTNKVLKEFGFKLYDTVFDYSFDEEEDSVVRIQKLTKEVRRVVEKYTPGEIYEKCKEIAEHNQRRAKEILINKLYFSNVFEDWHDKWKNVKIWNRHIGKWYIDYLQFKNKLETKFT